MKRTKVQLGADSSKKLKTLKEKSQKAIGDSGSSDELPSTTRGKMVPDYNSLHEFMMHMDTQRIIAGESVLEFAFKKQRVRVLTKAETIRENCRGGVVYWMSRDARVQDNWALLFAQKLALKLEMPLIVVFCLVPKFLNATLRHYKFMLGGLREVEQHCSKLKIAFSLLLGSPVQRLPEFVRKHDVGAIVCDFSPLRVPCKWVTDVVQALPDDVPLTQVDAHNVVPLWVASDKQEYAARTIRNKINMKLPGFLSEFPPVIEHPYEANGDFAPVDWHAAHAMLECDMSVDEVFWAKPGYTAACQQLYEFCTKRLSIYDSKRNDPTVDAVSGLSPWFHFGQISVQRCILEAKRFQAKYKTSVEAFCEEAIVRRELADNFCYYNKHYDSMQGLYDWAFKTLENHRKDARQSVYTLEQFEQSCTHDELWNAAQLQLVIEGKMHGFLRMYWAKKILEWTQTPEQALEYAIFLNDKYSLDGRDPNGYVGCMWSIGGIHDQGWAERPIFGKIRYMNYQGCKRKFDVTAFVKRYGGKVYTKK